MNVPGSSGAPAKSRRSAVWRSRPLVFTALLIGALGLGFASLPRLYHRPEEAHVRPAAERSIVDPSRDTYAHMEQARDQELRKRFDEAVVMLHARRFEYAVAALHRVLELSPRMPEAHVNMGYALLGLNRAKAARDFFQGALQLNARQANAYYGLAMAHEALGELPEALGAMRAYLHFAQADDRYRAKARAAIWEWESAARGTEGAIGDAAPVVPQPSHATGKYE